MTGLARGPDAVELSRVVEVTKAKREHAAAVRRRVAVLQTIAAMDVSTVPGPEDRLAQLQSAVDGFVAEDDALAEDPLFRVVNGLLRSRLAVAAAGEGKGR